MSLIQADNRLFGISFRVKHIALFYCVIVHLRILRNRSTVRFSNYLFFVSLKMEMCKNIVYMKHDVEFEDLVLEVRENQGKYIQFFFGAHNFELSVGLCFKHGQIGINRIF